MKDDLYLFNHGRLVRAWKVFGSHPEPGGGTRFTVWAPYARSVSVIGSFNDWNDGADALEFRPDHGVWTGVVGHATDGAVYKYRIVDSHGKARDKTDPFAFRMEVRPKTASLVAPLSDYTWSDEPWMAMRAARQRADRPIRIYEVHLGSWRRERSYEQLRHELADYVASMGFTHVEFLPVMEHPYDPSWGYQVCGYYAPTSRYGTPNDLRALVEAFHQRGVGVILDWVPAHFPRDEHGLARFDGTHLYEHEDPRRGEHRDWDTLIFNYERPEVRNFLVSNALYWIEEFHCDGIRVDAVASMLYRDYSREDGEWVADDDGSNEDRAAIAFLRDLNDTLHKQAPGVLTIAEESTDFPGVSRPTAEGGLGFDLKWNMGWMHDSLAFLKEDPVHRCHHQSRLTFALYYAFREKYLSPLSHDEVVHMKGSLLNKMPGDAWQKFANLRLLHAWQVAHPGKTLLFMGGEIAQKGEWNHATSLEWGVLNDKHHAGMRLLVGDLNRTVDDHPALYELDHENEGFEWIDFDDAEQSVITFLRWSRDQQQGVVWAFNFTPVVRDGYEIGVPRAGTYTEIVNTDAKAYAGSDIGNLGNVEAKKDPRHGHAYTLTVVLPPLAAVAFRLPDDAGSDRPA